jgi:hypothetical protein
LLARLPAEWRLAGEVFARVRDWEKEVGPVAVLGAIAAIGHIHLLEFRFVNADAFERVGKRNGDVSYV